MADSYRLRISRQRRVRLPFSSRFKKRYFCAGKCCSKRNRIQGPKMLQFFCPNWWRRRKLKARSDVARKMHQPGLFCFAHAKNAADRKDPIYCVLRSQLRKSEQTLSMAFGALKSSKFLPHHISANYCLTCEKEIYWCHLSKGYFMRYSLVWNLHWVNVHCWQK